MTKVLPVLVIIILAAIFFSPLLKVSGVNVDQNQNCVGGDPLNDFNLSGKNIFFISEEKLKNELKNKYACIDQVNVKKILPNKITLEIIVKKPIVKIENTGLFITSEGQIVANGQNLPNLYIPQGVKIEAGTKITDPTVLKALEIVSLLLKSDYQPENIRIVSQNEIAVYNQQGIVVLFSPKKTADVQVGSLQQVLAASKINSSKIEKIDLRFDKPVIEYKKMDPS